MNLHTSWAVETRKFQAILVGFAFFLDNLRYSERWLPDQMAIERRVKGPSPYSILNLESASPFRTFLLVKCNFYELKLESNQQLAANYKKQYMLQGKINLPNGKTSCV